jgi:hypothetical protein
VAGAFSRSMHRLHRGVGTALCLLMASWFASGAVMTCSPFPQLHERERLASASPLAKDARIELPPELRSALPALLAQGERIRLASLEGLPSWQFLGPEGRFALRATPPFAFPPLDRVRARHELEARFGPLRSLQLLEEADQWSVAVSKAAGTLPLYRAQLADDSTLYLTARTGELVQQTTRSERTWAWLGAIPHWVYFTWLRRQRELWRITVLALSTLGLVVTASGLLAGLSVWRTLRRRPGRAIRDARLRWHQRLGLAFGVLACSWLFSGALSLAPFQWSAASLDPTPLYTPGPAPSSESVGAALRACQLELAVRELELVGFAGHSYAVCLAEQGATRIVDLDTQQLWQSLPERVFAGLTAMFPGARAALVSEPDDYFYPTHAAPDIPRQYVRLALGDREHSTLYLDPARARLLALHTDRTRLERWLYHGLHSLDFPALYRHRLLWLAVIWLAMAVGGALTGLGVLLAWRRVRRKLGKRRAGALAVPGSSDAAS